MTERNIYNISIEYDIMMFLQGSHIPHELGHAFCISLSDLQIEVSEGQSEEISSHLQTLHVWGHNLLKAEIPQLFPFSMHEMSWSLQSKPTSRRICNYVGKQNHQMQYIFKNVGNI